MIVEQQRRREKIEWGVWGQCVASLDGEMTKGENERKKQAEKREEGK